MSLPLIISLPANNPELQAEIERELAPYAEIEVEPARSMSLDELKLVLEIINEGADIAVKVGEVFIFLRSLRDQQPKKAEAIKIERLGQPSVRLSEADDELLRRLLEG